MENSGFKIQTIKCGIILLAAGSSDRMGQPKQLLAFNGGSLLNHGIKIAVETGCSPVVLVLGANADLIKKQVNNKNILLIENKHWSEGMASSIRCGIEALKSQAPGTDAAIIMVCDQPFVDAKLLLQLVEKYLETGKPVIASKYAGTFGTPALFDKTIFAALLTLKGDAGAKKIMKENEAMLDFIDFPNGNVDIDTAGDYEALITT